MSSASSSNLSKDVEEVTQCPLCLKDVNKPKILPCFHTYCLECIKTHCKDKLPGDDVKCPLCLAEFVIPADGFITLSHDFFIDGLVEAKKLSESESKISDPCDGCSDDIPPTEAKTATMFCTFCQQKLCELCAKPHSKIPGGKHKTVNYGNEERVKAVKLRSSYCIKHEGNKLELYCLQCQESICIICKVSNHDSHECRAIVEICKDFVKQIQENSANVNKQEQLVLEQLKILDIKKDEYNRRVVDTELEIQKTGNEIKLVADSAVRQNTADLRIHALHTIENIEKVRSQLDFSLVARRSLLRYSKELLHSGNPCDIADAYKGLHARAEELLADIRPTTVADDYKLPTITSTLDDVHKKVYEFVRDRSSVAKRLIQSEQLQQNTNGEKLAAVRPQALPEAAKMLWTPETRGSGHSVGENGSALRQVASRTIEVRGLEDNVSKDQMTMYFENKKRSGGGPVEHVELKKHRGKAVAIVTFTNANDAMRVAQMGHHQLSNVRLDVALLQTWPELTSCAVRVYNTNGSSKDLISMFFESENRSGGGPIEDIFMEPKSDSVVITFESRQVAARVARRMTFTLQGVQLSARPLKPGRPPSIHLERGGIGVCSDCLLFTDLPPGAQTDSLRAFLSEAAGVDVRSLTFSTRSDVVLAQYSNEPDYDKVLLTLCSRPYRGNMLSVEPLLESKAIQVHFTGKVSVDILTLYFENEKRSGGGGIVTVLEWSPEDGYALLDFDKIDAAKRVLSRQHVIALQPVVVTQFYPDLGVIPPQFDSSAPMQAIPLDVAVECKAEVAFFIKTQERHRNHLEQ